MKSMRRQSYLIGPESVNRKVFLTTRNSVPRNLRWGQLLQQAPKVAMLKTVNHGFEPEWLSLITTSDMGSVGLNCHWYCIPLHE